MPADEITNLKAVEVAIDECSSVVLDSVAIDWDSIAFDLGRLKYGAIYSAEVCHKLRESLCVAFVQWLHLWTSKVSFD